MKVGHLTVKVSALIVEEYQAHYQISLEDDYTNIIKDCLEEGMTLDSAQDWAEKLINDRLQIVVVTQYSEVIDKANQLFYMMTNTAPKKITVHW